MMSKKMIKVISFILAGLMILSAVAVLVQVFAVDEQAAMLFMPSPKTGDNDSDYVIPIAIIAAAVVLAVVCIILPKLKKKN